MATYTTIKRADGTENSLAGWGIKADISLLQSNKEKDALALNTAESFDPATANFTWGTAIQVYTGRTYSGGVYSGGALWWQGYIGKFMTSVEGGRQACGYEAYSAWWLMERLLFKQSRKVFNGWATPGVPSSGATFVKVFLAESYLGESLTEDFYTGSQALAEVLGFVNECWNATKRGATSGRVNANDILQIASGVIDGNTNIATFGTGVLNCDNVFPKTRAQTVTAAEAVAQILRYFPTRVIWMDTTQSPPLLKIQDLLALTNVALTITAQQEKSIRIAPQYERQSSGVMIVYKQVNNFNNYAYPQIYVDKYPGTVTDYTPDTLTHVVELAGWQTTLMSGTVSVLALANAYSGTAATRLAFWQRFDPTLTSPYIDQTVVLPTAAVPTSVTNAATGATISGASALNILLPGSSVYGWMMGVSWQEANIQLQITYDQYADTAHKVGRKSITRTLTYRAILTNATNTTYTASVVNATGEAVPPLYPAAGSLAQATYAGLSQLQYEGEITFVGQQAMTGIGVGNTLTLTGPNHTYANLLVQSVITRPNSGELVVRFGAAARLDAAGMVEMYRATRLRMTYNMPSGRSSGMATAQAAVDETATSRGDNTMHNSADYQLHTVSAPA